MFNRIVWIVLLCALVLPALPTRAQDQGLRIELDTTQVQAKPALVQWGEEAKALMVEWYPRLCNLMQTPGFEPPTRVTLVIRESQEGIAFAQGDRIVVSSHWIEKHPEDIGLVVHELVHIVQNYRRRVPSWLTEGIADYLRWAIYEGKPQSWFQVPDEERGYRRSYRITGGFLLWLEGNKSPGIVARLNTAARKGEYRDEVFEQITGETLDALWDAYRAK